MCHTTAVVTGRVQSGGVQVKGIGRDRPSCRAAIGAGEVLPTRASGRDSRAQGKEQEHGYNYRPAPERVEALPSDMVRRG